MTMQFSAKLAAAVLVGLGLLGATARTMAADSAKGKQPAAEKKAGKTADSDDDRPLLVKSNAEWRKLLTPEQFRVTRMKGTERPFTGEYYKTNKKGVYRCVCCGEPLFTSETKFHTECGWPSFFQPADEKAIAKSLDLSHNMRRVEVTCRKCGAHLGHVFNDGPKPTGLRYCINSVALKLDEEKPADAGQKPAEKQGKTDAAKP